MKLKKLKTEANYSDEDVFTFLRNATNAAKRPPRGEITGSRYRRIEQYVFAIVDELTDHVEQGGLSIDEMVLALSAAATLVHARGVMKLVGPGESVNLEPGAGNV